MPNETTKLSNQESGTIECKVLGVYVHPTRNTPIVFVGDETESVVIPIWIGFLEAQAILFAWKEIDAPRPLTADLFVNTITKDLEATIEEVCIHTILESTYYAKIILVTKDGTRIERDARPSDAIAVALRSRARLTITQKVAGATEPEAENAKALLDFLRLESEDEQKEENS
jgi:bifunctional DNase/RNase